MESCRGAVLIADANRIKRACPLRLVNIVQHLGETEATENPPARGQAGRIRPKPTKVSRVQAIRSALLETD